jgi:drug/metabolite transporter (DMT)-like permease
LGDVALLLGLGSGLCWGVADFFGGLQSRRLAALSVAVWSQLCGGLALATVLAVAGTWPSPSALVWGVAGGLFSGLGLVLFYRGLAAGLMSIVAPIAACGAVIPLVVSYALGEVPTPVAMAGIGAALLGIVLVSRSGPGGSSHPSGRPWLVLGLALGSAVCFGCFYVCLHQGTVSSGGEALWTVGGARAGSLTALLAVVVAGRKTLAWPGSRLLPVGLVGVLDTTANVLFTLASAGGNLGVVSVLGSMYPVATVVLARLVLAERLARPQAAGVALALLGVGLMSLG